MNDLVKTLDYRGFSINIYADENAQDPRKWDNFGHMACFHNNYNLGDDHIFDSPQDLSD